MKKITEFDRATMNQTRKELELMLAEFADKTGVNISLGNARFNPESFTMKIEGSVVGGMSRMESDLELFSDFNVGDCVEINGSFVRLVGYKRSNRKYPYIAEETGVRPGKRFKLSEAQVRSSSGIHRMGV